MSSYTITLKGIIDLYTIDSGGSQREKIELAKKKLFDFDYPIFDEKYRNVFETHFIHHFFMREIGFESEGLFKWYLEDWLNINMPYFNKMFESELIDFDPLSNTNVNASHNKKNDSAQSNSSITDGTNSGNATNSSNGNVLDNDFKRKIQADTPDSRLQLTTNDGSGVLEYASNIDEEKISNNRKSTNTVNGSTSDKTHVSSSGNATINNVEDYVMSKTGKIGVQSFSKMLNEYRDSLLRVEKSIFKEMNQLFMLVY